MKAIEVMAGPFRTSASVVHSFPLSGTSQIMAIVEMPLEFLLCTAPGGWRWKQTPDEEKCETQVHPANNTNYAEGGAVVDTMNYFQMDDMDLDIKAKDGDDVERATACDTDSEIDVEEDQQDVLQPVSPLATNEDVWNEHQIKAIEDVVKSSGLNIKALEDEIKALEVDIEWDMLCQMALVPLELQRKKDADEIKDLEDAIKFSASKIKDIDDEIKVLEAELDIFEKEKSVTRAGRFHASPAARAAASPTKRSVSALQLQTLPATAVNANKHANKHSVVSASQVQTLPLECDPLLSKKRSVVSEQPKDVSEFRFQGKIKFREVCLSRSTRGGKLNYGWIEVNQRHLKALHEHPLWTSELERDVFFHTSDCCYEKQFGGDIVTFTVSLNHNGGALQAREVKLKEWH